MSGDAVVGRCTYLPTLRFGIVLTGQYLAVTPVEDQIESDPTLVPTTVSRLMVNPTVLETEEVEALLRDLSNLLRTAEIEAALRDWSRLIQGSGLR